MDPTARFVEIVQRSDAELPLDEALFLIAAHDHDVDLDTQLARLDALARDAPSDADGLARHLFGEDGFAGNEVDYTDTRNSYLDRVLDRRLGIPITLSILMMEVGRRRGLELAGIGMPGHFLVGGSGGAYYDPFHGGRRLDADGARAVFTAIRADATFHDEFLEPVGSHAILARVLANLLHALVDRAPSAAAWAARLRLQIPGLSASERRDVATLLGSLGRFAEAASALEAIVPDLDEASAARTARDAAALRARAN
ncbi:MAG TPA: transglutaminase-like domain-containing protein [Acidimicrobiia bacterium]|jgi:regulator of sirC expression with transglutaminase-like and TPR domain